MARLVLEELSRLFKGASGEAIPAVEDVNLTVEAGEFVVIAGPSGCGKTTTLRLIAGLEKPTRGRIFLDGADASRMSARNRDVAMLFQNPVLYPQMTARENMAFGLRLRNMGNEEIARRVVEAAEILDLTDCLDRQPGMLSGGQAQRVALGRVMVRRPRLVLLDEPLSNLDPQLRGRLRGEILKLHERLATTFIQVTHDQTEGMLMGQRLAVMKRGRLLQIGAPLEVYDAPANLFVAGFIGAPPMNFIRGVLSRNERGLVFRAQRKNTEEVFLATLEPRTQQGLATRQDQEVVLGIRPENIRAQNEVAISGQGRFDATVQASHCLGYETHVELLVAEHPFVMRTQRRCSLRRGDEIRVVFDMTSAHFFDAQSGARIEMAGEARAVKAPMKVGA